MNTLQTLEMALEALEKYCTPYSDGTHPADETITALRQQIALEKMAENARNLGLDYEPVKSMKVEGPLHVVCQCDKCKIEQPADEPVAWMHNMIEGVAVTHKPLDLERHPERWAALYKNPMPCKTCEALARTVMMDQTGHDTRPQPAAPASHVGWLVSDEEGNDDFINNPAALHGRHYKGGAPVPLQPAAQCEYIRHTKEGTHWCALAEKPAAQWVGLDWLPEHKCGLHLSHNEHRDVYETVEQFYEPDSFVSPDEWQKAVAEDSVWVLHWYPETPIGFHRIAASTLAAIEQALKENT